MADAKSTKKKAYFIKSNGMYDVKQGIMGDKVAPDWNPGTSKFKKRSGKGHYKHLRKV